MKLPDEARALQPFGLTVDATFGRYELRHAAEVRGLAWSSDGAMIASASEDATVRLWDASTGAQMKSMTVGGGAFHSLALSADGGLVLAGGADDHVVVWHCRSGKVFLRLPVKKPLIKAIALSPDGLTALVGDDRVPAMYSLRTGKTLAPLTGHQSQITELAFSPDGRLALSAGGDRKVKLHDVEQRKVRHTVGGYSGSLGFSPDGARFWSAGFDHLNVWDVQTGEPVPHAFGAPKNLSSIAFSTDQRLALLATGDELSLRAVDTGVALASWTLGGSAHLVFSPDGTRFAAVSRRLTAGTGAVRVFEVKSQRQVLPADRGHLGPVTSVAASGSLAITAGRDGTLKVWDRSSASLVEQLGPIDQLSANLSLTPNGERAVLGDTVWSLGDGSSVSLGAPVDGVSALSSDGQTLVRAVGPKILVVSMATREVLRELKGHKLSVQSLCFLSDGQRLVSTGQDGRVLLWKLGDAKAAPTAMVGHSGFVHGVVSVAGTSLVVSGGSDGALKVWDTITAAEQKPLKVGGGEVRGLASSSTGRVASFCRTPDWRSNIVELWDVSKRKLVGSVDLTPSDDRASSLCFTPDGRQLLVGTNRGVVLVLSW